ncbi:hypothetical protein SAMN05518865_114192 [Duganella sp. CF458]|uniref:hypothetical protein n=1 Tax=Duganella sp. CF458 TaxID=1884368 RepID=UPI0008F24CA2|nr:hypothetical protein [Duganella sp. CF458]SFG61404.1 hypothetical protein SAMN05518865_114192 [Duganella sp. CF458]
MNQPFDASIPVLTEIMKDELPAPVAAPATAVRAPRIGEDTLDWAALERRVSEQVLQQLSNRVDFVLEQRIKDSMAEILDHALHALTADIRDGLHDTIGKIVARAVQQEITHLQAGSGRQK